MLPAARGMATAATSTVHRKPAIRLMMTIITRRPVREQGANCQSNGVSSCAQQGRLLKIFSRVAHVFQPFGGRFRSALPVMQPHPPSKRVFGVNTAQIMFDSQTIG